MIRRLLKSRNNGQDGPTALPAGTMAPDFGLKSDSGKSLALSDFRGRPVVLVFYPADNSSVCSSQLALYSEAHRLFEAHDAQLLGVSVDDQSSHQAFASALNLRFPLLSDDNPPGATAKAYGVYNENDNMSERALFVLDAAGKIHWSYVAPRSMNPGANGILEALESLNEGA